MSNAEAFRDPRAGYARLPGQPLDIRGLVDAFARRWKLFVAVSGAIVLVAVVASLVLRPVFEATASIRIDPTRKSAIDIDAVARGALPDQALVDSEVKTMQSRDVAREVVQQLNLSADREFDPKGYSEATTSDAAGLLREEVTTDNLLKGLDVAREGETYIVALRFKSDNPAKAANIANAFARAYMVSNVRMRVQSAVDQSTGLSQRLTEASAEAQRADAALAQYKASNGIVTSATGGTITEQQIATVTAELATASSAAAAARSNYEAARTQISQAGINSVSSVINSPTIVDLRRQRAELLRNRAEIDARYGPRHPETIKVTEQVAGLEVQMREESQRIVSGLESDAKAAEARANSLRSDLATLNHQLSDNSRATVAADALKRDAEAKAATYDQLAASAQQLNQEEHSSESQARIVGLASVPTKAYFPNKPLFAALGVALGLIIGLAAVVVAEFLDAGVRTAEEVERDLGTNFVASSPLLTKQTLLVDGKQLEPWDYVVARPMSGFAEAMRTVRSAIMLSDLDKKQKVVLITSAVPNEGKTVCSASLARIMAMSGEKMLLVDCDLRRNALEGLLQTPPTAGLIEVLTGAATLESVIVKDSVSGLDILPLHKAAFTPRDLFGAKSMADLLVELRKRYDHVVLDGPPLLAVNDARTLATLADTVLVVAHWNTTPRQAIQATVARLKHDKASVAGVLLSMVDMRSRLGMGAGDASYYYGRYRGYYQN